MVSKVARQRAYDKGVWSEELAIERLSRAGFDILEQRYKTKFGEIDVVACRDDMLVFVEVKARQSVAEGLEAVNYRSRRRIEQAALHFIAMNEGYADYNMRFDVIVISGSKSSGDKVGGISVEHLDNAWLYGE